jgi:hypothetical protein
MSMLQQYWVVGGTYCDLSFAALEKGSGELHGPFTSYADALICWRQHSSATRSKASVRYSVVGTPSRPSPAHVDSRDAMAP